MSWSVTFSRSATAATKAGVDLGRRGAHGRGGRRRHLARSGPGLDGQELDLEPRVEAGLVGEERRHLGQGVARDHGLGSLAPRARSGSTVRCW